MTFSIHLVIQFVFLVATMAISAGLIPEPYSHWAMLIMMAASQVFGIRAQSLDMQGRSLAKQEERRTVTAEAIVEKMAEKATAEPVPPAQIIVVPTTQAPPVEEPPKA
jgi:hypothetical protein